jgi:hypothetical protein
VLPLPLSRLAGTWHHVSNDERVSRRKIRKKVNAPNARVVYSLSVWPTCRKEEACKSGTLPCSGNSKRGCLDAPSLPSDFDSPAGAVYRPAKALHARPPTCVIVESGERRTNGSQPITNVQMTFLFAISSGNVGNLQEKWSIYIYLRPAQRDTFL